MNAAFLNGACRHIFDFDDTHLKTIIHPAGPVASAILAYAAMKRSPARISSTRWWSGIEAEWPDRQRGLPEPLRRGWHIHRHLRTLRRRRGGRKLMGLTEQQMVYALGLAARSRWACASRSAR